MNNAANIGDVVTGSRNGRDFIGRVTMLDTRRFRREWFVEATVKSDDGWICVVRRESLTLVERCTANIKLIQIGSQTWKAADL